MEATQVFINKPVDKDLVYINSGILLSQKKNEILWFAAMWTGLENTMLVEIRQTVNDRFCIISPIYGI